MHLIPATDGTRALRYVFQALWACVFMLIGLSTAPAGSLPHNLLGENDTPLRNPWIQTALIEASLSVDAPSLKEAITHIDWNTIAASVQAPSHGFTADTLVVRLTLTAPQSITDHHYVIHTDYPLIDELRVYSVSSDSAVLNALYHTGDRYTFASRPIANRGFAFPVTLKPGETRTFILAAKSRDTLAMPLTVYTNAQFNQQSQTDNYILGIYFGGVFIMAVFFLALYINIHDRTLIYMAAYLVCLAGVVGSVTGVASQFVLPDSPELAKHIRVIWLSIAMICTLLFGMDFLESRKHLPRLHKSFLVTILGCGLLLPMVLLAPFSLTIQITLIMCVAVAINTVSATVIMLRKRYVPAIYYAIAWCWFLFGAVANVGRAFSLLPFNFWTEYGFHWGSLASVVCLALGIASKFNLERGNRLRLEKIAFEEKQNRLKAQLRVQEEQLKSQQAEAEAKAKGEFLANMSHEIRTPMNGVLGITQLLADTPLNGIQKNLVATIENSGKTLLGVLNDILDYSKIESGKFEVETIPVKPRDIIKNTLELFRQRAKEKDLQLSCQVDPAVPDIIASDPTRLSQILLNLTSNAFKFTHDGHIALRVSVEDEKHIRFAVIDSGIGLDTEQQSRLFQSFSQADRSTTRKYGGTGLGLYISSRLAELLGGKIGVQSQPNQGSTFWFTVNTHQEQLANYHADDQANQSLSDKLSHANFNALNVLVAEDNPVNQMVVRGLLRKLGITPEFAENGAECVGKIMDAPQHFHCILMDCEMPEMDGYEATQRLRTMDTIDQPVIIGLSANALLEQERKALAIGMDDYLRKPVDFEKLVDALLRVEAQLEETDHREQKSGASKAL